MLSTGFTDLNYIDDVLDRIDNGKGLISCEEYARELLSEHID